MRKLYKDLYNKYFYIPEDGVVRDNVFMARITVAVLLIVICLSAMGFTAYAYFTATVSSSSNSLTAASYKLYVTAVDGNNTPLEATGDTAFVIENSGIYSFTLTRPEGEDIAKTGYCIINISYDNQTHTFYTAQIGNVDENNAVNSRTYSIDLSNDQIFANGKTVTVSFIPSWGTYSNTNNDALGNNDGTPALIQLNITVNEVLAVGVDDETETTDPSEQNTNETVPVDTADNSLPTDTTQTENTQQNTVTDTTDVNNAQTNTVPNETVTDNTSSDTTNGTVETNTGNTSDNTSDNTSNGTVDESDPTETQTPDSENKDSTASENNNVPSDNAQTDVTDEQPTSENTEQTDDSADGTVSEQTTEQGGTEPADPVSDETSSDETQSDEQTSE